VYLSIDCSFNNIWKKIVCPSSRYSLRNNVRLTAECLVSGYNDILGSGETLITRRGQALSKHASSTSGRFLCQSCAV
jgi:hypothetical protein